MAFIKSFSNIEGYKFSMSKFTKDDCFLLLMFSNQLMALEAIFHWFTSVLLSSNLLILSKTCLLILPIPDFDGLISLNDGELGNSF